MQEQTSLSDNVATVARLTSSGDGGAGGDGGSLASAVQRRDEARRGAIEASIALSAAVNANIVDDLLSKCDDAHNSLIDLHAHTSIVSADGNSDGDSDGGQGSHTEAAASSSAPGDPQPEAAVIAALRSGAAMTELGMGRPLAAAIATSNSAWESVCAKGKLLFARAFEALDAQQATTTAWEWLLAMEHATGAFRAELAAHAVDAQDQAAVVSKALAAFAAWRETVEATVRAARSRAVELGASCDELREWLPPPASAADSSLDATVVQLCPRAESLVTSFKESNDALTKARKVVRRSVRDAEDAREDGDDDVADKEAAARRAKRAFHDLVKAHAEKALAVQRATGYLCPELLADSRVGLKHASAAGHQGGAAAAAMPMIIMTIVPPSLQALVLPLTRLSEVEGVRKIATGPRRSVLRGGVGGIDSAIKHYSIDDDRALRTFVTEVSTLSRLKHPSLCEVIGLFVETSRAKGLQAYLVMPHYENGSIVKWAMPQDSSAVKGASGDGDGDGNSGELPSEGAVRAVLRHAIEGIAHLHAAGVVHCDIKPDNILVDGNAHGRVADLDVSVDTKTRPATLTATLMATQLVGGTLAYMAPELQAAGRSARATSKADVYAFGVSVREVYQSRGWLDTVDGVREVVASATAKNPDERPSASELCHHPFFSVDLHVAQGRMHEETRRATEAREAAAAARAAAESQAESLRSSEAQAKAEAAKAQHDQARLDALRRKVANERKALLRKQREATRQQEAAAAAERSAKGAMAVAPAYWAHRDTGAAHGRGASSAMSGVVGNHPSKHMKGVLEALIPRTLASSPCGGCVRAADGAGLRAGQGVTVLKVVRIENMLLWKNYCRKKAFMKELRRSQASWAAQPPSAGVSAEHTCLDREVNEFYLFHGTSHAVADIVAAAGFDERVANMGGLYGAGVYFAENLCKSHQYTTPGQGGERVAFYSRVMLGEAHVAPGRYRERRPPLRPAAAGGGGGGSSCFPYDSVVGGRARQVHREYIVYDRDQTYPEFLVYYKV
jgi:serine/threonine protein kinase